MGAVDKAAKCVVVLNSKLSCAKTNEERICRLVCCCSKYPVSGHYRQVCADRLAAAQGLQKYGITPSQVYRMDGPEGVKPVLDNADNVTSVARARKLLKAGETAQYSVPDFSVMEPVAGSSTETILTLYEVKFKKSKDRWRDEQEERYLEIVDKENNRLIKLDEDRCDCDNTMGDMDKAIEELNEQEQKDAAELAEKADKKLRELMEKDFAGVPGLPGEYGALFQELERMRLEEQTPEWVREAYTQALMSVAPPLRGASLGWKLYKGVGGASNLVQGFGKIVPLPGI